MFREIVLVKNELFNVCSLYELFLEIIIFNWWLFKFKVESR